MKKRSIPNAKKLQLKKKVIYILSAGERQMVAGGLPGEGLPTEIMNSYRPKTVVLNEGEILVDGGCTGRPPTKYWTINTP